MLSVNNCNYSPSFGKLHIAKNPETKAALEKCSQETLETITKAGEMLKMTSFLDGVIKKVDNRLVFRVSVPKGFEFPNGRTYKPELQFIKSSKSRNGHYEHKLLRYGSFTNNGDTVVINGKDSLKLKKANTENGITKYEIQSSGFENITTANLMTLINKLKRCDYDLKEFVGGRLKLMPFTAKTSKAENVAVKL